MINFIYKKKDDLEAWIYSYGNNIFTVVKRDVFCLTINHGSIGRSRAKFKTLEEVSNFIELNYGFEEDEK